jgi:hypothetical protein
LAELNIVLGDEAGDALVAVLFLLDEPHPAATSRPVARSAAAHRHSRGWEGDRRDIHRMMVTF